MSDQDTSAGLSRGAGAQLYGWDHVLQCLGVIWTTNIGERVLREDFGNPGLRLLGENMTEGNILLFWQCLKIITDRWEPRFSIVQVTLLRTTPEEMRLGGLGFDVRGIYRPRAHLSDRTPEGQRTVSLSYNSDVGLGVITP